MLVFDIRVCKSEKGQGKKFRLHNYHVIVASSRLVLFWGEGEGCYIK